MRQHQTTAALRIRLARHYTNTASVKDEAGAATAADSSKEINQAKLLQQKLAALDYNNRRAEYNRQVSALRSEYAMEIAKQRAADKAEQ
jgi:hypothetical protein